MYSDEKRIYISPTIYRSRDINMFILETHSSRDLWTNRLSQQSSRQRHLVSSKPLRTCTVSTCITVSNDEKKRREVDTGLVEKSLREKERRRRSSVHIVFLSPAISCPGEFQAGVGWRGR